MDIHARQIRFAVALHHAEEFPAVALIKACVVGDEVDGGDSVRAQILDRRIEERARDPAAAVRFVRIDRADVRREVLPVVKIVFDHAEPAGDRFAVEAQIPAVLGFAGKILVHAGKVRLFRHAPF